MDTASLIIERFGGVSALAKLLNHKHPSTVSEWKRRGVIPARQQHLVLAAARSAGVALEPADFFAAPAPQPGAEAA